jgi:hypothetical protein
VFSRESAFKTSWDSLKRALIEKRVLIAVQRERERTKAWTKALIQRDTPMEKHRTVN